MLKVKSIAVGTILDFAEGEPEQSDKEMIARFYGSSDQDYIEIMGSVHGGVRVRGSNSLKIVLEAGNVFSVEMESPASDFIDEKEKEK